MVSTAYSFPEGTSLWQEGDTVTLPLVSKTRLTHDSHLFKFGLPEGKTSGLAIGQHIKIRADVHGNGEPLMRSYTPISNNQQTGTIDFVIKIYSPNEKYPDGAHMTRYLDKLQVGDKVEMVGPQGRIRYHGQGKFEIVDNPNLGPITRKKLGFIAGGTGIAPCYSVMKCIEDHKDEIDSTLLFANHTPEDILAKPWLDELKITRVHHIASKADESWTDLSGRITPELI